MNMESVYWEDSQLRGPATDHWHVSNAAPDHKCAQCEMLHRKPKVPHRTTCVCGKEIFLDYSQTQEIVPNWRHSESKLIMCRGEGSVAIPATEAGSITSEPAPPAWAGMQYNPANGQFEHPGAAPAAASPQAQDVESDEMYEAREVLRLILNDLPNKRDWLDPALERRAKMIGFADPLAAASPLRETPLDVTEMQLDLIAADAMAKVADDWVERHIIDARSALADARLNYGQPFTYKYTKPGAAASLASPSQPADDEVVQNFTNGILERYENDLTLARNALISCKDKALLAIPAAIGFTQGDLEEIAGVAQKTLEGLKESEKQSERVEKEIAKP